MHEPPGGLRERKKQRTRETIARAGLELFSAHGYHATTVADIAATDAYAERLRRAGCVDVSVRSLGWRAWYGGPWVAGRLVRAKKPAR